MLTLSSYIGAGLSTLAVAALVSGVAAADCTREMLLANAEVYMAAQQSGKIDDLQKLFSSNVSYRQNNKPSDWTKGLLSKAVKFDHNRTTADTTACASYTELVSASGPYVVGTQLRYDGGKINLVDSIVATTGDWMFNAKNTLNYVSTEDWSTLDESKRASRDVLKAAGDSYLDMWTNGKTAMDKVPCTSRPLFQFHFIIVTYVTFKQPVFQIPTPRVTCFV